ncbi:MAG TPA: HlyD family efflux transporter periplasmic adaptor subunit [Hyphomicrobiaceae bacterium]|nr:HlyD family efflux transporter periplasmic adaptor subunit [Hyphomicrobiaceae bacterium]
MERLPGTSRSLPRLDIRGPVLLGAAVLAIGVGGALAAAAVAPIDKGASLSGTLVVETRTRAVQHDRGGVVAEVHVKEGAEIDAGALIVTLDTSALGEQIAALRAQQQAASRQMELVRQEVQAIGELVAKQLIQRSRLLALERQLSELEKEAASLIARISIAEQDARKAQVRAPVSGRLLMLAVHGTGGVLTPGQTVAEIVPKDDRLVIEGRLSLALIDLVKPGMPAKVWLTGTTWREQRPLAARVAWISPDSVEDKRSGVAFFSARIELADPKSELVKEQRIHPGQRAEILVVTGARTLLDQLLDPIMRNVNRAFRS